MSMPDDDLIDRTAHAMTRGEPSLQLRHAVRARIEGLPGIVGRPGLRKQARHVSAARPWIALAAAAVLVLSAIVSRTIDHPHVEPLRSTRIAGAPVVVPPVTLQPIPSGAGELQIEASDRVSQPRRTPARSIVLDPLVIEPIRVPLIAVDSSSGVMPIEIEPLQIEPLQPQ
jgi:hypothetical protein